MYDLCLSNGQCFRGSLNKKKIKTIMACLFYLRLEKKSTYL